MISEEIPAVRFLASVGIVGAWTVSATGVGGGGAFGGAAGSVVLGDEKHMFLVFY
jgi:hypothetical protein